MSKSRVSNSFAYGCAFIGSATSPGIAWADMPAESSSPNRTGAAMVVESRNAVLRDGASRLDQLLSLLNQASTGGSWQTERFWLEAASEYPASDHEVVGSQDTSEAVATIRSALSLQVKELATILGVSPTIYSWLRDEEKPQLQNRKRIAHLLKFAKTWNSLSKSPIGAAVRNQLGEDSKSLVELLSEPAPDDAAILSRMQAVVGAKAKRPKGIHEIAKRHGIDLTKVRESQAEFDVLTGKPFHED